MFKANRYLIEYYNEKLQCTRTAHIMAYSRIGAEIKARKRGIDFITGIFKEVK